MSQWQPFSFKPHDFSKAAQAHMPALHCPALATLIHIQRLPVDTCMLVLNSLRVYIYFLLNVLLLPERQVEADETKETRKVLYLYNEVGIKVGSMSN